MAGGVPITVVVLRNSTRKSKSNPSPGEDSVGGSSTDLGSGFYTPAALAELSEFATIDTDNENKPGIATLEASDIIVSTREGCSLPICMVEAPV